MNFLLGSSYFVHIRKVPKDPNAPRAPLSFNPHPPPPRSACTDNVSSHRDTTDHPLKLSCPFRKEPPDPNAPLPPLPLHLHPPPAPKRPSLDGTKERWDSDHSGPQLRRRNTLKLFDMFLTTGRNPHTLKLPPRRRQTV